MHDSNQNKNFANDIMLLICIQIDMQTIIIKTY